MRRGQNDHWAGEILGGADVEPLRAASLGRLLESAGRRRRRRRVLRVCGAWGLVAVLLLGGIGLRGWLRPEPGEQIARNGTEGAEGTEAAPRVVGSGREPDLGAGDALESTTGNDPVVRRVTDDELLALFPGRSVALIGRPGEQRLVFLDGAGPWVEAEPGG